MWATVIAIILLLFAMLLTFVVTSAFLGFVITRVPFVRTRAADAEYLARELGLNSGDFVFDLGSGDGSVLFALEGVSGSRGRGFELTWWTYLLAKAKSKIKNSKAEFMNRDFFKQPWSEATVVYGYLYPFLMARVEEKFLRDCRPGTLAVIRDFPLPSLKPRDVYFLPGNHEVYVYQR